MGFADELRSIQGDTVEKFTKELYEFIKMKCKRRAECGYNSVIIDNIEWEEMCSTLNLLEKYPSEEIDNWGERFGYKFTKEDYTRVMKSLANMLDSDGFSYRFDDVAALIDPINFGLFSSIKESEMKIEKINKCIALTIEW